MNLTKEVSGLLLGKKESGDKFQVKYGLFTLNLEIKALTYGQVVEIAGEVGEVRKVDKDRAMFEIFIDQVGDLDKIINCIVIATDCKFRWFVKKALRKLPISDIETLWSMVQNKCDLNKFFFIIISAKSQMDLLSPKAEES